MVTLEGNAEIKTIHGIPQIVLSGHNFFSLRNVVSILTEIMAYTVKITPLTPKEKIRFYLLLQ